MAVEPVGAVQRRTARTEADPSLGRWDLQLLSRVLDRLLGAPVPFEALLRRAVSLGLAQLPPDGEPCVLSAEAASRLCLAGYRLAAQVDFGTERSLRHCVREGCTVLVVLGNEDEPPVPEEPVTQLHELVSLGELAVVQEWSDGLPEALALRDFLARWAAGGQLVLAASEWQRLPRQGRRFFGGSRDGDGTLHWTTAGCDTDAAGELLRF